MRIPDFVSGLVILALATGALIMALGFPSAIGQPLGPGVFPTVISGCLVFCSLLLIGGSVRRYLAGPQPEEDEEEDLAAGPVDPATWGVMAMTVAMPLFYMFAVEDLGFTLTSFLILFISTFVLWGGLLRSALFAITCVVAIDGVFRGFFGIPLDLGLFHIPLW